MLACYSVTPLVLTSSSLISDHGCLSSLSIELQIVWKSWVLHPAS